jgi:hypothetical protein
MKVLVFRGTDIVVDAGVKKMPCPTIEEWYITVVDKNNKLRVF